MMNPSQILREIYFHDHTPGDFADHVGAADSSVYSVGGQEDV